ncbi:ectoine/hydroxyectoine ABC transporter substrate-binding protein EhuB [Virgibacillus alimentarius]|uniref:Polar amino acid transport system substrate-binding protein n=1 Tax=Virgibacillus alimentarius TaxID=698769 RepID=A0ABS4S705_9BACI|nr:MULTISPECIES: ectoine/hydroxyectoine ABC transporter substrate-binding protein EhuB [Virgibacillus]MBP2257260.1 polar amino acid transport system substrate-binding protein [Virgibacillus alimentarius]HLR67358.1 ectoine/hydroxyectoine ABC transporter substrate-binding protein EhuB [Virgibacillus sp.]
MKKLLFFLVLGLSLILFTACGSDDASGDGGGNTLEELQEKGKIKVGFANEKPYGYENEDGELTGASVETAKAVFAELGIDEVEGHLADYDQLVPGLQAKKFDAITSGMAITPERCESAAFAEPDMKYGEGLIVQKGNPKDLHSYEDIANDPDVTVSVMSGATENDFLKSEGVDESQIQSAPDIPATFSAVESGRADATTGTEMTIKMALESANNDKLEFVEDFEQPDIEGVPSYGAVAFHPENEELLEAFNEKLAELKEDGTIAQILEDNGFSAEANSVEDGVTAEMVCNGEE